MEVGKANSQEKDLPKIKPVSDRAIGDELKRELGERAFDEDKLSWDCDTKFVT